MIYFRANSLTTLFSTASYLYALLALTSYWAFLIPNESLPSFLKGIVLYSMDKADTSDTTLSAILTDLCLLCLFTIPHSTLARETTKKLINLPTCIERPLFVLQSGLLIYTQMHFWRDFSGPIIWDVTGFSLLKTTTWILFVAGFLFLVTASFALDHFHLFGLSQGTGLNINKKIGLAPKKSNSPVVVRWHYSMVAHPIMTGILTFLWATPVMTAPHLLLSTFNTLYIMAAVILLEEPSLKSEFGQDYTDYLKTVPRFCPMSKSRPATNNDIRLCPHFNKKLSNSHMMSAIEPKGQQTQQKANARAA